MKRIEHPTVEERRARGKAARDRVAPSGHSGWVPADDRPDPVALLEEQNATREPDLVPVRHGRMMVSPFTFYRGAAKIMAADLKDTPTAGLDDPAVRGCAPVELRWVRVTGAGVAVRPQRLRRDAPRPVRVRRQAHGGQLHHRRPEKKSILTPFYNGFNKVFGRTTDVYVSFAAILIRKMFRSSPSSAC